MLWVGAVKTTAVVSGNAGRGVLDELDAINRGGCSTGGYGRTLASGGEAAAL